MMDLVLSGLRWSAYLVYLDGIIVYSLTVEEHVKKLRSVFECLKVANVKVKPKKCLFAQTRLQALGHVVDEDGIASILRRFVRFENSLDHRPTNFAKIAKPLHDLTKQGKSLCWGEEQEGSFKALKERLIEATQLAYPDYGKLFDIHPDACEYGIATECNYSTPEKECLALVWAMKKFHCFIWGMTVRVVTDHHSLCWLTTKKDLAGRLDRWALLVQGYEPQVLYKSGKLHDEEDALSRYQVGPQKKKRRASPCYLCC
ncbi:Uncharacterized protein APZ42_005056 [Daphnia magna]|uniref:Reverse transcriptase domain-containing protein n=1 Tax=Daphnia magna TaxID=35525 RepID=A0A162EZE4_9CRUS|nr:Uncharacterized protein APZ42_005056 [Daphnia magna]